MESKSIGAFVIFYHTVWEDDMCCSLEGLDLVSHIYGTASANRIFDS
jgi:hypothetical protein